MIPLVAAVVAQAGDKSTSDTGLIVGVVAAAATILAAVLGALITVLGNRTTSRIEAMDRRLEGIEKNVAQVAIRVDEGMARLTDRIDRLYGPGPRTVTIPGPSSEDMADYIRQVLGDAPEPTFSPPPDEPGEQPPEPSAPRATRPRRPRGTQRG